MSTDQQDPLPERSKRKRKRQTKKRINVGWVIKIVLWTFVISIGFSFISSQTLSDTTYYVAFSVLLLFIFIGVLFDIIGISVTSAVEKPFHSMAARKIPGSIESLRLIRNAEKVSSFCNDVVGDISGIISGTTGAAIVSRLVADFSVSQVLIQLLISGLIAAATVGGKALGKTLAINFSTNIVHMAGRVIFFIKSVFRIKRV